MSLPISNVIRRLRRERDITQEELAAAVGVTYQSVSRWENGQAYPDMELIAKIAGFFNISTDILFGTDKESINTKLEAHYEKINKVQHDPEEFYQACKAAYDEFPKEYSFGIWLCRCYIENNTRPYEEHLDEIRAICKNIMDNCTDEDHRIEAMHMIAVAEDEEHLSAWLDMIPCWKSCKEVLLASRYSYRKNFEKCELHGQQNLLSFVGYIFYNSINPNDQNETAARFQLILKVIDIMRDTSTDVDAWLPMRAEFHLRLAGCYFFTEQYDIGYTELENAIDLYVKYAELPIDTILSYNNPLMNLLTDDKHCKPEDDTNDKGEYICFMAYENFAKTRLFDSVRNDERYKKQIDRLKPYLPK